MLIASLHQVPSEDDCMLIASLNQVLSEDDCMLIASLHQVPSQDDCMLIASLHQVPSEEFANTVKPGMTWAELDAKLREGVETDREERQRMNAHKAITKALVDVLPSSFEVPETLVDQATKERFAMMLGDMREQGQSDEKLKELITPENYERYKKITKPMVVSKIKGDFAIKAISQQQGLVVPQDQVCTMRDACE